MRKVPNIPQKTTLGFAFSMLDRALREGVMVRKFGKEEVKEIINWFNLEEELKCVFCGSNKVERWDHLVPVRNGGATVLGNMVPACQRCDDSKQHRDFEEWMLKTTKGYLVDRGVSDIDLRIKKLRKYQKEHGFEPTDVETLIPKRIHQSVLKLRKELTEFLGS